VRLFLYFVTRAPTRDFYAFGVQRPHRDAEKPTRGRVSADGCFVAGHYFNLIFPLSALSLGFIP
jgi:hypothetical protein